MSLAYFPSLFVSKRAPLRAIALAFGLYLIGLLLIGLPLRELALNNLASSAEREVRGLGVELQGHAFQHNYPAIEQVLMQRAMQPDIHRVAYWKDKVRLDKTAKPRVCDYPDWFGHVIAMTPSDQQAEIRVNGMSYGTASLARARGSRGP